MEEDITTLRSSARKEVFISFVVILVASLIAFLLPIFFPIAVLIAVVALLYAFYHYVEAKHRVIFLHDHYLQFREGVINIRTIDIPYRKIDNVRVNRNLVDRIFGLVKLKIDTPGDKNVEVVFGNADYSSFLKFYDVLKEKIRRVKGNGNL